mmetsp:Transcript_2155/g.5735  ORF Transcript_2155/g.5735 Transcript_2155/m.5735 type:complete len:320 (-) Transcript_2155:238-1197(-)
MAALFVVTAQGIQFGGALRAMAGTTAAASAAERHWIPKRGQLFRAAGRNLPINPAGQCLRFDEENNRDRRQQLQKGRRRDESVGYTSAELWFVSVSVSASASTRRVRVIMAPDKDQTGHHTGQPRPEIPGGGGTGLESGDNRLVGAVAPERGLPRAIDEGQAQAKLGPRVDDAPAKGHGKEGDDAPLGNRAKANRAEAVGGEQRAKEAQVAVTTGSPPRRQRGGFRRRRDQPAAEVRVHGLEGVGQKGNGTVGGEVGQGDLHAGIENVHDGKRQQGEGQAIEAEQELEQQWKGCVIGTDSCTCCCVGVVFVGSIGIGEL